MSDGALQMATARFTAALKRLQASVERRLEAEAAASASPDAQGAMLVEELNRLRAQRERLARELEFALHERAEDAGRRQSALSKVDAAILELRQSLKGGGHV